MKLKIKTALLTCTVILKVDLAGLDHASFQNKFSSRLGNQDGGSGSLRILTSPPGAEIHLDSDYVGKSNAELSNVGEGTYNLVLTLRNYRPQTTQVTIKKEQSSTVRVTLEQKLGSLKIEGTEGLKQA